MAQCVPSQYQILIGYKPLSEYSQVLSIGYLKGKSAIAVARRFSGRRGNFGGERLCVRDYVLSAEGFELGQVKAYIRLQEPLDCEEDAGRFSGVLTWRCLRRLLIVKPPLSGVL